MTTNERNLVFLVIFDTCDVMHNWSISLLPPIVLDNLFGYSYIFLSTQQELSHSLPKHVLIPISLKLYGINFRCFPLLRLYYKSGFLMSQVYEIKLKRYWD